MESLKDMSADELISNYEALSEMIGVVCCYSLKDLIYRDMLEAEINRRGYEIEICTRVRRE